MITNAKTAKNSTIEELIEWLEVGHRLAGRANYYTVEAVERRLTRLTTSEVSPEQIERISKAILNSDY